MDCDLMKSSVTFQGGCAWPDVVHKSSEVKQSAALTADTAARWK